MNLKITKTLCGLAVAGILSLIPYSASAAPVADQTQTLSFLGTTGPMCSTGMMASNSTVGSVFTAGLTGALTSIAFPIQQTSTADNLLVSVYSLSGGLPAGQPLASQTIPSSSLLPLSQGGTLTVNFDTPASVVSGSEYAFTFKFPSCSSMAQLSVPEGIAPADKRLVFNQNNSATWFKETTYGMNFTTYVDVPQAQGSPTPVQTSSPSSPPQELAQTGNGFEQYFLLWSSLGIFVIASGLALLAKTNK